MKLKLIEGGYNKEKNKKNEEQLIFDEEDRIFNCLLKKYFLGDSINNKIVDISCFYGMSTSQLADIISRIGG